MNKAALVVALLVVAAGRVAVGKGAGAPVDNPWVGDSLLFADETTATIGATGKSRHIAFSKDESLIATDQPPTIWDAKTLTQLAVADVYPRHSAGVLFRGNGDLIVGTIGSFAIYRRDGRRLNTLHRVGPNRIAIQDSPHVGRRDRIHLNDVGNMLLVPGPQGSGASIFDLSGKSPRAVSVLYLQHNSDVTDDFAMAAVRNRKTVTVLKRVPGGDQFEEIEKKRGGHFRLAPNGKLITIDHGVFLFEENELRQIATLESVSNAVFDADATQFAYVTRGPQIKIVDLQVGNILEMDIDARPTALAYSPSGQKLATVDPQVGLRLYELDDEWQETSQSRSRSENRVPLKVLEFLDAHRLLCQRTSFSSDGRSEDALVCIDVRTGKVVATPDLSRTIKPIAFNARKTNYLPYGPAVLAAAGEISVSMELENHNHPVACLSVGGVEKTIHSWPLQDLREVALSPDATRMAVGTYAGLVHLVDLSRIVERGGKKNGE